MAFNSTAARTFVWRILAARLLFAFAVLLGTSANLLCAEDVKRGYDIPAADAVTSLKQFAEQSGFGLIVASETVKGVRTNAIKGEFTADDALRRMLEGTGLRATRDRENGAFAILRAEPEESEAKKKAPEQLSHQTPMKRNNLLTRLTGALALFAGAPAFAQSTDTPPVVTASTTSSNANDDTPLLLSPFEVTAESDHGYLATSAQSGTRLRTELKDIAAAVSVVTKDFMTDIGARNLEDLLVYTTGTEVGGLGGNFSEANNSQLASGTEMTNDGSFGNVAPGTRVRGLTSADSTRDFFLTGVPMDGYNVERVEITRGANAMLFGLGSPAGIVNTTLIKADPRKNSTEVGYRTDKYGSYRGTLDHNQVLLNDKLAVRFATVYDKAYYKNEPAYTQTQRGYLTTTYRPFRDTQLRVSGEWGQNESNRPRNMPPYDGYTYWWDLGRPAYNLVDGTFRLLGTPTWVNPVTGAIVSPLNANGSRNSNIITTAIGTSGGTNNMTLLYSDPQSSQLGIPGTTAVGYRSGQIANTRRNANGTLASNGPMGLADMTRILNQVIYAGHPTQNFWKNVSLTDPSIFNFYEKMLDGPNKHEWALWQTLNVALEQHFFDRKAGIEIAWDRQRLDYGNVLPLSSASAHTIRVDINEHLPNGMPNPNFGRPLTVGFQTAKKTAEDNDALRGTAYYNLDLRKLGPRWLGRFLGTHQLTASHTRTEAFRENYGATFALNSGVDYSIANQGRINDSSTQGRAISLLHYIGANGANSSTPVGNLSMPVGQMPVSGMVPILWAGDDTRPDSSSPAEWVIREYGLLAVGPKDINNTRRASGIRRTGQQVNSSSFVAQDRWFEGRLVTTLGWRRDDVHSWDAGTAAMDPATGLGINDPDLLYLKKVGVQSERTFSWGAVGHAPNFINRHLPFGSQLSLTVNRSDNFRPTGQRYSMFDDLIAPQMGTTKEYGALLSAFHGKLVLRYAHYETASANASVGLPIQSFADSMEDLLDQTALGNNAGKPGVAEFAQWMETPEGRATVQTFRLRQVAPNDWDYDRRTGQVTGITDLVSKGDEFEVIYNPTRNWRISANASKAEAIRSNTGLDMLQIVNSLIPIVDADLARPLEQRLWQADNGTQWASAFRQNVVVNLLQTTRQDGAPTNELRKWRWNAVTNYRFTEGIAKGFNIGAAVRWQDKVAIGYPVLVDPDAGPLPDVKNPHMGPTETNYDAWIGYSRKLFRKYNWRVQLNVKNIGVGNKLIPIWAQPDGSISAYRIAEPQKWTLSNTVSF